MATQSIKKNIVILSRFMCPQNIDVENFIQSKAIGFARQRLAMTYWYRC